MSKALFAKNAGVWFNIGNMQLKKPSISKILNATVDVWKRFPVPSALAAAGSVLAIVMLHANNEDPFVNALFLIILGYIGSFILTLLADRFSWKKGATVAAFALLASALVAYGVWLPENMFRWPAVYGLRYLFLLVISVLVATVSIFLVPKIKKQPEHFWDWTRSLFFSLVLTAFWAGVLMAGLSIALASIDYLFAFDVDRDRYAELYFILQGIFSGWFFLSRVPKDLKTPIKKPDYPKELRRFAQFVMLPLVGVYFIILYAYTANVVITQELPKGLLVYMISGFSFGGILTFMVLWPLRKTVSWVRKIGTGFFIALLPQIVMLFWAIGIRINDYGITVNRYLVVVFGLWLLGIALFFLIRKSKDIRVVPVSLAAIVLIISFGPWSAFAVSERQQVDRLEGYLTTNGILVDDKVTPATGEVSFDDRAEISSIVRYLVDIHGVDRIQPWFEEDLLTLPSKNDLYPDESRFVYQRYDLPDEITQLMGIVYVTEYEARRQYEGVGPARLPFVEWNRGLGAGSSEPVNVSNFDYLFNTPGQSIVLGGDTYQFGASLRDLSVRKAGPVILYRNGDEFIRFETEAFLNDLVERYGNENINSVPPHEMELQIEKEGVRARYVFDHVFGDYTDGVVTINGFGGSLLLDVPN